MPRNKTNTNIKNLVRAARNARARAYAPYSKFLVGAALLGQSGKVFSGCNVENLSFGLTMCAERVCVGSAIAGGEENLEAIAIVAESHKPILPCGACRQVLAEFNPRLVIYSATPDGPMSEFRLNDLLPMPRQGIME